MGFAVRVQGMIKIVTLSLPLGENFGLNLYFPTDFTSTDCRNDCKLHFCLPYTMLHAASYNLLPETSYIAFLMYTWLLGLLLR